MGTCEDIEHFLIDSRGKVVHFDNFALILEIVWYFNDLFGLFEHVNLEEVVLKHNVVSLEAIDGQSEVCLAKLCIQVWHVSLETDVHAKMDRDRVGLKLLDNWKLPKVHVVVEKRRVQLQLRFKCFGGAFLKLDSFELWDEEECLDLAFLDSVDSLDDQGTDAFSGLLSAGFFEEMPATSSFFRVSDIRKRVLTQ